MDMSLRIQEDVVRLDIAVDDTLRVDISQRAAYLCDPEPNGVLCEAFSRDMEAQITTIHQIHYNVALRNISTGHASEGKDW